MKRSMSPLSDLLPIYSCRSLFILLSLVVVFCACKGVYAQSPFVPNINFTIFEEGKVSITSIKNKTFVSFKAPLLVGVKGGIVALAEANTDDDSQEDILDIVTMYIKLQQKPPVLPDSEKVAKNSWMGNISIKLPAAKNSNFISKLGATSEKEKVFLYVESYSGLSGEKKKKSHVKFDLIGQDFIVGEMKKLDSESPEIIWELPKSLKSTFEKGLENRGGANSAVGVHVFPATYKKDSHFIPTVMYTKEDGKQWELMSSNHSSECFDPSVVKWGDEKLLMITSCINERRMVYESIDNGQTWAEAVTTLSRVWRNIANRTDSASRASFVTANISGRVVMLFLQPVIRAMNVVGELRLWMTDGTRIYNAGVISEQGKSFISGSLLYKDDQLYCLYKVSEGKKNKIMLTVLDNELKRVKYALKVWGELTEKFLRHCNTYGSSYTVSSKKCDNPIPTEGLVGFLSNNSDGTSWKDEYLCVGGTVKGGTKVSHGLRFNGIGAGAQWPVGNQGQNQRYHFANYVFTLAATLAIHKRPLTDAFLLGARLHGNDSQDLLGLSITADQKWKINRKNYSRDELSESENWELQKTYHVALTMQNNIGQLYLNGEQVWNGSVLSLLDSAHGRVANFYFGGDGNNASEPIYVTVADVFLYNRPLNSEDIKALFKSRINISVPEIEEPTMKEKVPPKASEAGNGQDSNGASAGQGDPPKASEAGNGQDSNGASTGQEDSLQRTAGTLTSVEILEPSGSEPAADTKDRRDDLVTYGISTCKENLNVRREVTIPREVLDDIKNGYSSQKSALFSLSDGVNYVARKCFSFFLLGRFFFLTNNLLFF